MKKFFYAVLTVLLVVLVAGAVAAQNYEIKVMTPGVQAAVAARKGRFGALKTFKADGLVGENNRGYVAALGGGADVGDLVNAENSDRKAIYKAIVAQNELGAAALATVESVFAGVQRDKASAGEKIQDADGNWTTK